VNQSNDLIEKINVLSQTHKEIAMKLLNYIEIGHSRSQIQSLIRDDIREILLEESKDDFK